MYVLSNAMKNIRRHARKSALYALICAVAAMTLQVYSAGIDAAQTQLRELPDAIPISASVASLDGKRFAGLQIQSVTVDGLLSSPYVGELKLTTLLGGWIGEKPEDYMDAQTGHILAVNALTALEGFSAGDITWLAGYSPDALGGDEAVCLMDNSLMAQRGLSLGDVFPLNPYYYKYGTRGEITYENLELTRVRIVGAADLRMAVTDTISPSVVLPMAFLRGVYDGLGVTFHASSASFFVRDSLALNDFKAQMKELRLNQVITDGSAALMVLANQGTALVLNDATFISAATRLQESISLLTGFLPLMAVVLAAVGYFVAYLMIQSRREEYAVLRLLGKSKPSCMALYFTEMAALTVCGSLCGVIISAVFGIGGARAGAVVFLLFSLCFLLGSVIALLRLGRTNVMLALARAE
jgi:hypothetical protein